MRSFFTPSMGVACLALAVALSGTAYAVTRLPANSVGTKQVINHSLQTVDFKRGTLLRGPVGGRGPQGPKGDTGSPGPGLIASSLDLRSKGAEISTTAGVDTQVTMVCPAGELVLMGGFHATVPVYTMDDYGSGSEWNVIVRSTGATHSGGLPGSLYVYTECVKTS